MKTRISLVTLLAALLPAYVSAQAPVSAGERVRVYGEPSITGVVKGFYADSLVLLPDGFNQPLAVPLGSLDRVEVSIGRKSRRKGFVVGAGIGGGLGLGIGLLARSDNKEECTRSSPACEFLERYAEVVAVTGPAFLIATLSLGVLLGGGIGALVHGGERWEPVPLPSSPTASIQVRPTFTNGVGFVASIPFGGAR